MKKNECLQAALGMIDDEIILDAKVSDCTQRIVRLWPRIATIAAAVLLIICCTAWHLLDKPQTQPPAQLTAVENLWEAEDFRAYSVSYHAQLALPLSSVDGRCVVMLNETDGQMLQTDILSISNAQTIKFEALVAQRYAVYYAQNGYPIFYDTQQDRQVDLQERILGDTSWIFDAVIQAAAEAAQNLYPGMLDTENNRNCLEVTFHRFLNDTKRFDWDAMNPDTDFMDHIDGYKYKDKAERKHAFSAMCWELLFECHARLGDEIWNAPYGVYILGMDAQNGMCIVRVFDAAQNGIGYLLYDIKTDTYRDLPDSYGKMSFALSHDGYMLRFSNDGNIATIAYPAAGVSGADMIQDITQRQVTRVSNRKVANYQGERIGVCFLNEDKVYVLNGINAASEAYISEENSFIYFKLMEYGCAGKSFLASDVVWYNRLRRIDRDTDRWAFHSTDTGGNIHKRIILQGNFVRFAADETVAIMEREGKYYAYSLEDGSDITEAVVSGKADMYAHEVLSVSFEDGMLYKQNLFTGEDRLLVTHADQFILSSDGAFVFTYCEGESHVTCWNIATLENCSIEIAPQMCSQLFAADGAVLRMNYNDDENTLMISFYLESDITDNTDQDVDFYALLKKIKEADRENGENFFEGTNLSAIYSEDMKMITDLQISQEILDAFRLSADKMDSPDGVVTWETYYPPFLTLYENRFTIFEKLGLTQPQNYLDVNGTMFVLYEDGDEKLCLHFSPYWRLYDYQDEDAGFAIIYVRGSLAYDYRFINP